MKRKEIIIKETDDKIIGFCPYCGERIFTEFKDVPFAGVFTRCIKCEANIKTYPAQPDDEEEVDENE